ncbi:hypothetical protein [Chondrinema litorale]|uniref:hypothetical protein n=1 Tax=Chondrinema litorale TaxID=2994555 RepID=UPI002542A28C|nr:hypothetical protein [Chondrinema litorale]UZR94521.1 hypothetical protein OQ292_01640 [Chondrinema litorale]
MGISILKIDCFTNTSFSYENVIANLKKQLKEEIQISHKKITIESMERFELGIKHGLIDPLETPHLESGIIEFGNSCYIEFRRYSNKFELELDTSTNTKKYADAIALILKDLCVKK